jgi:predicted HTH transcriptional regulator
MSSLIDLTRLLPFAESDWLDWKADFPPGLRMGRTDPDWERGKGTLLKDLVALANSEGDEASCFLVYGVGDRKTHREVLGISSDLDDAIFQQWAEVAFHPPPKFLYQKQSTPDGHCVGVFQISRVPGYPHVARLRIGGALYEGQVWFRHGSKNTVANRDDLARMFLGEAPMQFGSQSDPEYQKLLDHFGHEQVFICSMGAKDSHLLRGYRIAHFPGTRREIWSGEFSGRYECVLMLKPRQAS